MDLNKSGLMHGTDKSSETHDYLRHYERILAPLRDSAKCVIEIGVLDGASLRVWRDFFPDAQIVGVDIREKSEHEGERIKIEVGPQQDPDFLLSLVRNYDPDFVIDDGSHVWPHQIATFQALYPAVRPGGVYICEDLHTSKSPKYSGGARKSAAEYFAHIMTCISADGPPLRMEEDSFTQYVRERTALAYVGRRFVAFQKC